MVETSYSAVCKVGRLVEARLVHLNTRADADEFVTTMRLAFNVAGPQAVVCADWREARVLPPDAADGLLSLLRWGNAKFERSAVLLTPEHATFALQVERVFREAGSAARRAFRQPAPMLDWLGEALTPTEFERAARFLGP